MKITLKQIVIFLVFIISLIALNVYQWQNPKVVEVPQGKAEIDSTAWVQRAAYTERGIILDSVRTQNQKLFDKIRSANDAIANYSYLTGSLRTERDSLKSELDQWQDLPGMADRDTLKELDDLMNNFDSISAQAMSDADKEFLRKAKEDLQKIKNLSDSGRVISRTSYDLPDNLIPASEPKKYITERQFGGGLFLVTGIVEFRKGQFRQRLELEQIRDIRIDVVNTINKDRSRIMTYITSSDFESLEYQTFTELKPQTKLPKFWIGLAAGVVGTALILK